MVCYWQKDIEHESLKSFQENNIFLKNSKIRRQKKKKPNRNKYKTMAILDILCLIDEQWQHEKYSNTVVQEYVMSVIVNTEQRRLQWTLQIMVNSMFDSSKCMLIFCFLQREYSINQLIDMWKGL